MHMASVPVAYLVARALAPVACVLTPCTLGGARRALGSRGPPRPHRVPPNVTRYKKEASKQNITTYIYIYRYACI